jgi:hypothetical protein
LIEFIETIIHEQKQPHRKAAPSESEPAGLEMETLMAMSAGQSHEEIAEAVVMSARASDLDEEHRNWGAGRIAGAYVCTRSQSLAVLEKETDESPCMSKRRGCKTDAARTAHQRQ